MKFVIYNFVSLFTARRRAAHGWSWISLSLAYFRFSVLRGNNTAKKDLQMAINNNNSEEYLRVQL